MVFIVDTSSWLFSWLFHFSIYVFRNVLDSEVDSDIRRILFVMFKKFWVIPSVCKCGYKGVSFLLVKGILYPQQGELVQQRFTIPYSRVVLAIHSPQNTERAEGTTVVLCCFSFYTAKWRDCCLKIHTSFIPPSVTPVKMC